MAAHTSNFPSPNKYLPQDHFSSKRTSSHGWGFGASKRYNMSEKSFICPAPGQYTIPNKIGEGPHCHIGSKIEALSSFGVEERKTRANPGPGAYKPLYTQVEKADGQGVTIKSRTITSQREETPGPGTYKNVQPPVRQLPSVKFGHSPQRTPLKASPTPGPG